MLRFTLTRNGSNRVLRDWNGSGLSAWTNVKRWARENGAAGAWLADGRFRLFFVEAGKLRQTTWKSAAPA